MAGEVLDFDAPAQHLQHLPALVLQCELAQQQRINSVQRGLNSERGQNKALIRQLFQFQSQLEAMLRADLSPLERRLRALDAQLNKTQLRFLEAARLAVEASMMNKVRFQ